MTQYFFWCWPPPTVETFGISGIKNNCFNAFKSQIFYLNPPPPPPQMSKSADPRRNLMPDNITVNLPQISGAPPWRAVSSSPASFPSHRRHRFHRWAPAWPAGPGSQPGVGKAGCSWPLQGSGGGGSGWALCPEGGSSWERWTWRLGARTEDLGVWASCCWTDAGWSAKKAKQWVTVD